MTGNNTTTPAQLPEQVIRGGVKFKKIDKERDSSVPQGDATLKDAEITIYNISGKSVKVGDNWYEPNAAVLVLKTDENGAVSTSGTALPYGTYYAVETAPSRGYLRNTAWRVDFRIRVNGVVVDTTTDSTTATGGKISETDTAKSGWFKVTGNNTTTPAQLPEQVIRGGVKFKKIDKETDTNAPQGVATLKDAEITIYNISEKSVKVGDKWYEPNTAVLVLKTDEKGAAGTDSKALPYGTYYAVETAPSIGYLRNTAWRVDFQIREDGVVVDTTTDSTTAKGGKVTKSSAADAKSGWFKVTGNNATSPAQLPEQIMRADVRFKFNKQDIDGYDMAYIPFRIARLDENGKEVEWHVIVTDENGWLDTATRPKTGDNVNCLDEYDVQGVFSDESMLRGDTGVWFGEETAKKDGAGSLIYANYQLTELRCEANKNHDLLIQKIFKVNGTEELNGIFRDKEDYDLERDFINLQIHPESVLTDPENRSASTVSMGTAVTVQDKVTFDHLKIYRTYRVDTEIKYVSRDGQTTRTLGSVTGEEFKPKKIDSTETATATVYNTVTIKTDDLNGGSVNAVDRLYVKNDKGDWVLLAEHNLDLDEESQRLEVPYIGTVASDSKTGDHVGTCEEEAEIKDTVYYENLDDKQSYTLEGTLRYADTGEVVIGLDGKPCVVTKNLRVEYNRSGMTEIGGWAYGPKNGQVIMPSFYFDASDLGNRTLVVTEVLYFWTAGGPGDVVVNHYDLTDEGQSIHFVDLPTEATDISTGTRTAVVGTTTIVDKVTLRNTIPGMKYTVTGNLVYLEDCVDSNGVAHKKGDVIATHEPVEVVAESSNTVVYLSYEVDASALEGQSGVVFEDAWHNGVNIAKHHDYEAVPQTPQWPKVRTSAVDGATHTHTGVVGDTATIVDTVSLSNLVVGDTYKIMGVLMYADGSGEFKENGKPVTAESAVFEATAKEMTVDVVYTFNSSSLSGKSLVVFEKLFVPHVEHWENEETGAIGSRVVLVEVARHEDLKDKGQTVDYPGEGTSAQDGKTKDEVGTVGNTETIIDTVTYWNLRVGEEYTIKGTLHYQEDFTDKNGVEHKAGDTVLDESGEEIAASVTFTAEQKNGTIDLIYTLNSELLRGTSIVVFEDLYSNNVKVYSHADLEDKNQRIDYPEVGTTAVDGRTEDNVGSLETVMINDVVELTNLTVGKEYTVNGILMDKATGKALLDNSGSEIKASYGPFKATETTMTVEMTFTAKKDDIEGITTVVFEDLLHNDVVVSYHRDLNDEGQSVHFPKIGTTATADDTEDHVTKAREEVTITDVVRYENLLTDGREYTLKGTLVDKANGKPLLINGEEITAETTFTPEKMTGEVEMTFTFNASALAGTTLVVFENLYYKDIEVAIHADINDEGQTVYIPDVGTKAIDEKTLIDHTRAEEQVTVIDYVSYTNLLPGKKYTVKGYLMDKKTGEPIVINGSRVESETTFTAEKPNGTVEMYFTFDATSIIGAPIVVFEHLYYKDIEVAVHADIEDEAQTDYIPEIGTSAIADDTQDHVTMADEEVTIIDTVSYQGLKPNTKYELVGILMDKETGKPVLINGNEITSGATFVTGDADEGDVRVSGSIEIEFTFDARTIAGTTTVVFETLYRQGKEVAVHADINDKGQTVYIPDVETTAKDAATGDHDGHLDEKVTIIDKASYKNLLPGKTYTITGTLMVKETGKELLVNGKPVTASKTFTAKKANGSVELEFVIDSRALAGTTIVVFEKLEYNGITVAVHADIEDEDQAVNFPKIGTKAVDKWSGTQSMTLGDNVVLKDTVSYKGLTPGKTYIVKGEIMDKATSQSIGVTAEARFTPETADGETVLEFMFNTNQLRGKTLVVFEKVYDLKNNLIAEHEDINDRDQTVYVPDEPPKTGDEANIWMWLAMALLSLLGFMTLIFRKKRVNNI